MGKDQFLGLREALALEWMEAHSVGPLGLGPRATLMEVRICGLDL